MKKLILTSEGIKVIDAPEKPIIDACLGTEDLWNNYQQALEKAIKEGVLFKDSTPVISAFVKSSLDMPVEGKLYDIPEGYVVQIDYDFNDDTRQPHFSQPYAILVPKQEPTKVGNDGFMFDDNSTYPNQPTSIEDAELLIPFPDEKLRDGKEIGIWQEGWEKGFIAAMESFVVKQRTLEKINDVLVYQKNHTAKEFNDWFNSTFLKSL